MFVSKILKISICLSCIIVFNSPLTGQNDSTKLAFNQVEVVKNFEVKLKDASRIQVPPTFDTNKKPTLSYNYEITPVPANIAYPEPEIRALAMQPDDPIFVNNGFLKGGYGNRKSPFAEAGFHKTRKDIYNFGVYGKYFGINDEEKVLNHKMSDINLDVFGSYVWKNNLRVSGQFENDFTVRQLWHEYLSQDSNVVTRRINKNALEVGLGNIELSKNKLNYQAKTGFKTVRINDQKGSEQMFFVEGEVEKHRTENLAFVLNAKFETIVLQSETWSSLFNLHTEPHIIWRIGKFTSLVGASALWSNDKSAIFPKLSFSYPVYKKHVQVFAGSDQKIFTNSVFQLTTYNPFMNVGNYTLSNTISKEVSGGFKGEFSHISYQLTGGVKWTENHVFFQSDSVDVIRLLPLFDNARFIFLSGNIEYQLTDKVTVGGRMNQNFIKTDSLASPWHTPGLQCTLFAKATFFDNKLRLNSNFQYAQTYRFLNELGNSELATPALFDLGIAAEYFPLEYLGIYVKGDNLFNNNFQRWQGYRNIGTQVSGGIIFTF
ncbi:MAG: hypothetical protein IPN79_01745 [Saprospiraceae bacterium]|nr:hypothetical protein [Saprospiraceae bacterium]